MAASCFDRALACVLQYEGGWSGIASDPGNWTGGRVGSGVLKGTKYGIAANSYPTLDIKHLTIADVGPIYRRDYWDKVRGDDLPPGIDLCVVDFAVNSGPGRAIPSLQRAAAVADDGKLGPITLKAVHALDPDVVIERICADRLAFLSRLSTWKSFGKGWSSRVAQVKAASLALAGAAPILVPKPPPLIAARPPDPTPPSPPPIQPPQGGFFARLWAGLVAISKQQG